MAIGTATNLESVQQRYWCGCRFFAFHQAIFYPRLIVVSLVQAFRFIVVSRASPLVSSMDDIEADTLLTDELMKPLSEDNVVMKGLTREAACAAALLKGRNGFATLACHTPSAREGIWGQALQKAVWNILCDVRHDAVIALTTRQMQGIVRRAWAMCNHAIGVICRCHDVGSVSRGLGGGNCTRCRCHCRSVKTWRISSVVELFKHSLYSQAFPLRILHTASNQKLEVSRPANMKWNYRQMQEAFITRTRLHLAIYIQIHLTIYLS